ncbi:amidohydrolase family protein [Erwiniaceae bacterium BAC15a-03b]|uniref:Amidohydrolase family protein n=1 Tax=Winslowiella arboricola TaxID=2978220 RepID=A0A9J6PNT6_9GAMM|nr:amidohydrolase family protein [Winslowiella arboricola]MCU5774531.1 amidohydrolase family protein [Winslowiella arboricola]MCU5778059.1 amidohydrolase family protein [Winslowiella arboricola]
MMYLKRLLLGSTLLCSLSGVAATHDTLLIRNGYILTMKAGEADLQDADLLIRGNQIVQIGQDLAAPGAQVINAKGKMVLPGFVDAHSHLSVTTMRGQFRNQQGKFFPVSNRLAQVMQPDDIYTAMYSGALELLQGGITTSGDFFDNIQGPAWGDAGFNALKQSGIRAIMYYGGPDKTTKQPIDLRHLATLTTQANDRVQPGLAWRLPRDLSDQSNWALRKQEYQFAGAHQLPLQVHVSGDADAMFNALISGNYLNPSVTVVHATNATPQQLAALEKAGGSLALTPLSEQRVGYGLTRLDHFSAVTRQGLGIDGNSLAGSADMFASMRLLALTLSGATTDETRPQPRQLLELATRRSAQALGLGAITGTLENGKRADVQIINPQALNMSGFAGGDPAAFIVYSARPENVETVIVDGKIVKHHGEMQGIDMAEVLSQAQQSAAGMRQRAAD